MIILILTNNQVGLYKFRKELLERLISEKYVVYVSVPEDVFTQDLTDLGVTLINNGFLNRRGTNPFQDIKLAKHYESIIKQIHPNVVLTYTIKPNVYGGYVCGKLGVPYIANVTGLGTSILNGGTMQKLALTMYRQGLKKADRVFFQNDENRQFMLDHKIVNRNVTDLLPGSGVNTTQHRYEPYPEDNYKIVFTTVGRIMRDKGINELLSAAEVIRTHHPETEFRLIGDFDEGYEERVNALSSKGVIKYLGFQKDVHRFMAESHAIIHASYHEGMSNILLEAASTGRPVIATDVHGCKETFDDGITGIAFKSRSVDSLVDAVERFLSMSHEQKELMGKAGRLKIEKEFDRKIVVDKYMNEIEKVINQVH